MQRHRHGDARDQRRARPLRRNRNTTRITRHDGDQQRALDVVQRGADGGACGRSATSMSMSAGIEACSCGSSAFTAVDGVDDVGAGLAVDDDQHRRLAVGEPGVAQILDRIDRPRRRRDSRTARAVAVGDDQRRVVGGRVRLVVGVDLAALVAVLDRALRAVGVGGRRARRARPPARCRIGTARSGLSSTRTAGSELPPTSTSPTPSTCDSFCCSMLEAAS